MKTNKNGKSRLTKIVAIIGMVSTILTVIVSAFSGYFIVKLFRYINTAQKALPKMEKAAQLYIENNTKVKPENKAE